MISSRIATHSYKEIKQFESEQLTKDEKKHIFKDIKALALYKISGTVLNGTDSVVISSMLGAGIVGYVSNYSMIISELYNLMLQFLNSVTASIGNMVASKDKERQYDLFKSMNFACEFVFCICTVCLFTLLDEFVGSVWFSSKYVITPLAVLFMCVDFFLKGNTTIIGSFRNANGLFVQGQYRPLAMAILNIIVSVVAVILMGLPGVFLGTVVSRLLTQVWYDPVILYRYAFKKSPKEYFIELIVWSDILGVGMILSRIVATYVVISIPILSFVIHGILCVLITVILSILIFCRSKSLKVLIGYLKKLTKKSNDV